VYGCALHNLAAAGSSPRRCTFEPPPTPGVVTIGESVFEAKYNIWSEDHFTTNWCLRFYGRIVYCVYVASSANAQQHLIPAIAAASSPSSPIGLPVIITPESLGK
jgi:hypothetical protein